MKSLATITEKDIEVITKISALVISERDRDREFKKRLGKYRGIL